MSRPLSYHVIESCARAASYHKVNITATRLKRRPHHFSFSTPHTVTLSQLSLLPTCNIIPICQRPSATLIFLLDSPRYSLPPLLHSFSSCAVANMSFQDKAQSHIALIDKEVCTLRAHCPGFLEEPPALIKLPDLWLTTDDIGSSPSTQL